MKQLEVSEFTDISLEGCVIVDVRKSEDFVNGFLKESISIPFDENFVNTFQELVESSQDVLFVADENDISAISAIVKNAGIGNVQGYLKGGIDISKMSAKTIDMLITIDAEEFVIDYRFDEFYLVDVRTAEEFENEHVEHAENITLNDLEQLLIDLDTAKSYYIYADSSAHAITAGSLFKQNGFNLVKIVAENFENIKASGISLVTKNKKSSAKFSDN